jgi:N-acyl-D-amino-acid deacylase
VESDWDLLIEGGRVIDGSGGAPYHADVVVAGGRIADVLAIRGGSAPEREGLSAAACTPQVIRSSGHQVINAAGLVVAPGFIDIHTHADIALLARPTHEPKVMQGVTTEVFSNCGLGFAPVTSQEALETQRVYLKGLFGEDRGVRWDWRSVGQFLDRMRGQIATNALYLIPHGAVRVSVMGMAERPATRPELDAMVRLVEVGMAEGARGMSSGLWYAPMSYAAPTELIELCRVVAEKGGFWAVHMREYGDGLLSALAEVVRIAEMSGVPLQVSHLQTSGPKNAGLSLKALEYLDSARQNGVDVMCDSYPYIAGSTLLQAMLPTWAVAGGPEETLRRLAEPETRARIVADLEAQPRDYEQTFLSGTRSLTNEPYEGRPLATVAQERQMSAGELICTLLEEEELLACFISHHGNEEDVRAVLAHPAQVIGSDGLHLPRKAHPRLYGTFPRVLARYVREEGLLSLEAAVRKMTGAPADRMGLKDRGYVRSGMAADLVLFDPALVEDSATYKEPNRYPMGMPCVLVNGILVKEGERHTGALAGQVL